MPSVGELIAHILDRLEYVCAHDVAFRAGADGEAMGEHDGGASESGSGCSDGSSVDSDAAEQRWHDGVELWTTCSGLRVSNPPPCPAYMLSHMAEPMLGSERRTALSRLVATHNVY